MPTLDKIKDYIENIELWEIVQCRGFGARLTAPGYLDCTDWCVLDTEQQAVDYLAEYYLDEEWSDDE